MTLDPRAVAWIERVVGGRVVRSERQPRWRPAWFLDVEVDGGIVPLYWRGARGALDHGISDLAYEHTVLEVLEDHGIPVPHVYGRCPDPEGLLLERVAGHTELVDAASDAERQSLLDQYVDILTRIHAIPVERFEERGLRSPTGEVEVGLGDFDKWEHIYRSKKRAPAPMEEFGIGWIRRNVPTGRSKVCFCVIDCAQFLFEHGRINAIFDLEFSYLADPAAELAGLRVRGAAHSLGDLRRAIARYCAATGQTIDPRVIDYHTVRFGWVNPLSLLPLCEDPPVEIDYVQYKAWYVLCSRWSLDVLGRLVGARLDPVELPPSTPSIRAPAHRLMVRGLDPTSDSGAAYERSRLQRVAVYLERADRYGPALDAASLDELAAVLGQRPLSRRDADAELERLVLDAPPGRDAELVRLFHRQLQREEFLLEPVLGYLRGSTMPPID